MTAKEVSRRVSELAIPLCQGEQVNLWDVTFEKEGRDHVLTVFIDSDSGISIDSCERISRALDPMLDDKVFDSLPPYTLSVSSAGLERRLSRPEHFEWAIGKKIVLTFYRARDGQSELVATLKSHSKQEISVLCENGEQQIIPSEQVALTKLYFEF